MKKILLPIFALVAMVFAACGGDDTAPAKIAVTGISLDKTSLCLEIGEEATVKATIEPAKASNKEVVWSIADATIASVSNGVVKGVAVGETTLTAKTVDGNFTATIPVKVVTEKVPVEGIKWTSEPSETVKEGKSVFLFVDISPANATDMGTIWESSNPEVLSVGEIKAVGNMIGATIWGVAPGKATITATTNDGGFEVSCEITVLPIVKVSSITISPKTATIEKGDTEQLTAAVLPNDAENKAIEWSSSDTAVATVDANGLVTGVANGEATITATAKDGSGVKGEATITVVIPPTSVTFDGKTDQEIYTWWGKEVDLKAKVTPEGVSLKHLTWRWNDPNSSKNPDGLKYNVTDDKATLTYTWPSQTSGIKGVNVRAFYGDGNTVYAETDVYFQTFAWLLRYSGNAINYDGLDSLSEDFDYKWNWGNKESNKLAFIAYYRSSTSENALPRYYKEYYIPTSEYTLTSSDPSKLKVTKSADGESWDLERLNTTDLVAVTLTYKCGDHTQTYTINLIP